MQRKIVECRSNLMLLNRDFLGGRFQFILNTIKVFWVSNQGHCTGLPQYNIELILVI